MHAAKTLFLSLAPLMVTESLPLILVTALYEFDIIRYLFFGHLTRPVPPSRRKLDYIGFLPIPEKAKSWQGSLVAVFCGLVWFFSEFTLDIVLIVLGDHSATELKKQIQQHEEKFQHDDEDNDTAVVQDSYAEEDGTGVKVNKMNNHQHHHHHHRDIYDRSEEFFGDHQPQQQQQGGRRWRREFQREDEREYDASAEGDDVVEQLDLQDEFSVWNSMKRSVEYRDDEEGLFAVSAALIRNLTLGADAQEGEEGKAVLSSTVPDVFVTTAVDVKGERESDLKENNEWTPAVEIRLLPAHDLERNVDVLSGPDTDADADVDTEAADEPRSVSSSPLSSTSTSCSDLHYETEHNDKKEKAHTNGDFKENTKAWVQLSVSTRTAEAPSLDDCRTTAFIQQHGDDHEAVAGVYGHPVEQRSKDRWSEWGPYQLSRAVKTFHSIQRQKQERVVTRSSTHRLKALFPPLSLLAADSTAESLSDDSRIRDEKKKMLRYAKKKKAAKAKRASGMPLSLTTGGVPSPVEDERLSA
ncbi:hypothetical protein BGZ90_006293 [Linnemannia elongata]|nr:hypothetical protein BGZ90_006293 [Linnemannia elongata]